MPQTKAQTKNSRSRASQGKSSNARGAKSGQRAAARRSTGSRSRPSTQSSNGRGATRSARKPARSAGKRSRSAGKATQSARKPSTAPAGKVAEVAQKARTPLIAGGVTIAGAAGAAIGLALRSAGRRRVLGVPVNRRNGLRLPGRSGGPKLEARKFAGAVSDAARRADRFGQRLSSVASTVAQVSETAEGAAKKS